MDDSERLAEQFLKQLGYSDVRYEPDGNVPPDFLIDGRIAVEVRRLNQMEATTGTPRGLEEVDIRLLHQMESLLNGFGPREADLSWWVIYRFSRPVENWKTLKPKIVAWLKTVKADASRRRLDQSFGSFSMTLVRTATPKERVFQLGGTRDEQSGGMVLEILQKSLRVCIAEKTRKIATRRGKYPEWWLVLIDHIGYTLDDLERELLRKEPEIPHTWDKVFLVNPLNPTDSFQL